MRKLLFVVCFALTPICHGADKSAPKLFADTECKAAYEYHFLNRAAAIGDIDGARLILRGGADPNGKGYAKYPDCVAGVEFSSPLMVAVWMKDMEMIKLLLKAGADPNLKEGEGQTPTSTAKRKGLMEIHALLVKFGGK